MTKSSSSNCASILLLVLLTSSGLFRRYACLAQADYVAPSSPSAPIGVNDFVVRAGVGVGPITLGASPADVYNILGPSNKISQRGAGVVELAWSNKDIREIRVVFTNEKATQILVTSPRFATPEDMKVNDSAVVFLQNFSSNDNEMSGYLEKNQQGAEQFTWYGKTTKGISVRVVGPNAANLKITALIVHYPSTPIFPQLGATLRDRQIVPSDGERILVAEPKPIRVRAVPKTRLSSRQKATAQQVYRELDILQKQLASSRNGRRVEKLVAQAKRRNQPRINTLPKGEEPRVGLENALEKCGWFSAGLNNFFKNVPESTIWKLDESGTSPLTDLASKIRNHLNEARNSMTAK